VRFIQSPAFTRSADWARLRYDFMRDYEGRCHCCRQGSDDRVKVNVDHIHPRTTHPQFALSYANLQVLCSACNRGKGNRDRTDWRYRSASAVPNCPACQARMQRRSSQGAAFWGSSQNGHVDGLAERLPKGKIKLATIFLTGEVLQCSITYGRSSPVRVP
jgi:hypothetical protein